MNNLEEIRKQADALEKKEEFVIDVLKCADAEQVQSVFEKYEIKVTLQEAEELIQQGNVAMQTASKESELNEDELEEVTGGSWWRKVLVVAGGVAMGVGLGAACGAFPAFTPVAYKIAVGYGVVGGLWSYK